MSEQEGLFGGEKEVGVVGRVFPSLSDEGGGSANGVGYACDEIGAGRGESRQCLERSVRWEEFNAVDGRDRAGQGDVSTCDGGG
jgi:hypothetical protein